MVVSYYREYHDLGIPVAAKICNLAIFFKLRVPRASCLSGRINVLA